MLGRVLVVDNCAARLQLVRAALELAGFSVASAEDGVQCLLKLKVERPDLVIVEGNLPVVGGLDVVRAIRGRKETKDLPLIVLTGRLSFDDRPLEMREDREVYLARPLKLAALIAAARSLLPDSQGTPFEQQPTGVGTTASQAPAAVPS